MHRDVRTEVREIYGTAKRKGFCDPLPFNYPLIFPRENFKSKSVFEEMVTHDVNVSYSVSACPSIQRNSKSYWEICLFTHLLRVC